MDQPNPKDGRHVARVQSRHLSWPTDSAQFSPLPQSASKSNQFILPFVPTTRRRVERHRERERGKHCRLCRTVSGKRCHHTMPASCDGSGIEKGRGGRGKGKNATRSGLGKHVAMGQELIEILRRRHVVTSAALSVFPSLGIDGNKSFSPPSHFELAFAIRHSSERIFFTSPRANKKKKPRGIFQAWTARVAFVLSLCLRDDGRDGDRPPILSLFSYALPVAAVARRIWSGALIWTRCTHSRFVALDEQRCHSFPSIGRNSHNAALHFTLPHSTPLH